MNQKILFSIFCFCMFGLFLSCTSNKFKSKKQKFTLKGNPSTGYTWIYKIEDESIINLNTKIKYLGSKSMSGAPSRFTYTITSLKPGATKIFFEYKRPWEEDPIETKVYEILVDEQGKIQIK